MNTSDSRLIFGKGFRNPGLDNGDPRQLRYEGPQEPRGSEFVLLEELLLLLQNILDQNQIEKVIKSEGWRLACGRLEKRVP